MPITHVSHPRMDATRGRLSPVPPQAEEGLNPWNVRIPYVPGSALNQSELHAFKCSNTNARVAPTSHVSRPRVDATRARISPFPPRAGEGWDGGRFQHTERTEDLRPHPSPPPQAEEGAESVDRSRFVRPGQRAESVRAARIQNDRTRTRRLNTDNACFAPTRRRHPRTTFTPSPACGGRLGWGPLPAVRSVQKTSPPPSALARKRRSRLNRGSFAFGGGSRIAGSFRVPVRDEGKNRIRTRAARPAPTRRRSR